MVMPTTDCHSDIRSMVFQDSSAHTHWYSLWSLPIKAKANIGKFSAALPESVVFVAGGICCFLAS
jgi:hypothetical protein